MSLELLCEIGFVYGTLLLVSTLTPFRTDYIKYCEKKGLKIDEKALDNIMDIWDSTDVTSKLTRFLDGAIPSHKDVRYRRYIRELQQAH